MSTDGYGDQIVTISVVIGVTQCDVGASPFQDTSTVHVCSTLMAHVHSYSHAYISVSKLVSCAFSTIPICPFRIFHSLVINLQSGVATPFFAGGCGYARLERAVDAM